MKPCKGCHFLTAIVFTVLSVISDLVLAALPILFLRNLQIELRTKIGLCLLMGFGVLYVGLTSSTKPFSLIMHSTAICCTVRTVLSGAMTDPDLTCESQHHSK